MVLINDKKFACATCIKGHRVSGCTHTDRPLFEVKKKGRPTTQCNHCRDKRKTSTSGGQVHTKCSCGDPKAPNVIMPTVPAPVVPAPETNVTSEQFDDYETRKGVPGSKATFPNGLKDVHDMAAAAEALSGLGQEQEAIKVAERKVANLLNPCQCQLGGPCKCCQPKRERAQSIRAPSPSSGSRTPVNVTDGLVEMFKTKATTSTTPPEGSCCSAPSRPTINTNSPTWAQLMQPRDPYLSPNNMHHPAHTSPHVHKAKLYSPYSTSGHSTPRHNKRGESSPGHRAAGWASGMKGPGQPKLRPISDMNKLLGAVFKEDGTLAETIPRSALGLPGISAFDAMALNGGVKVESMDMDVDVPIQFPTNEDVVIGACTCGEDCDCSGCATHGIPPRTGTSDHVHDHGCGDNCKSSFDCANHLSLPSGITSIGHLLSLAAANVPPPAQKRPVDLGGHAHDTRVLPPAVQHSEDAARALGVVKLKPLECCNGRCQCAPGKCVCEKECCGCCLRCACEEDGDSKMDGKPEQSSCCAAPEKQPETSSCCSTGSSTRHPSPARSTTVTPNLPVANLASDHSTTPPLLSPDVVRPTSRQVSPGMPSTLRRASSTAGQTNSGPATLARRATVTHGSRGASGKQASKAMALHAQPNHPHSASHSVHTAHPRPILPKPAQQSQLGVSRSSLGSRVPSPNHATAPPSAQVSRQPSPTLQAVGPNQNQPKQMFLPEAAQSRPQPSQVMPDQAPAFPQTQPTQVSFGNFASDEDFMAFVNQFQEDPGLIYGAPSSSEGSVDLPLATPDISVDGQPFDRLNSETTGIPQFDPEFIAMLNNAVNSVPDVQSTPPMRTAFGFGPDTAAPMQQPLSQNLGPQLMESINPGFPLGITDMYLSSLQAGEPTQQTSAPVYRQLPPQLQQALSQNPALAGQDNMISGSKSAEPNMIDLSKPLNATDVERILRALQEQQAQQAQPAQPQMSVPNNTMGHRLSNASSISSSGYVPMMSNQIYPQPGQFSVNDQNGLQSLDMPSQPDRLYNQQYNYLGPDEVLDRYLNTNADYLEDPSTGVTDPNGMHNWAIEQPDLQMASGQFGMNEQEDLIRIIKQGSGV